MRIYADTLFVTPKSPPGRVKHLPTVCITTVQFRFPCRQVARLSRSHLLELWHAAPNLGGVDGELAPVLFPGSLEVDMLDHQSGSMASRSNGSSVEKLVVSLTWYQDPNVTHAETKCNGDNAPWLTEPHEKWFQEFGETTMGIPWNNVQLTYNMRCFSNVWRF